jgi:hypothetical protein
VVDGVRPDLPAIGVLQLSDLGPRHVRDIRAGAAGIRDGRHADAVGDDVAGARETVLLQRGRRLRERAVHAVVEGEGHERLGSRVVHGRIGRPGCQQCCRQRQHRPRHRGELGAPPCQAGSGSGHEFLRSFRVADGAG